MIEPARRALRRRDARAAGRAVRRRPSAGPRRRAAWSGTRPTCSCPRFTGSTTFRLAVPAQLRPGGRRLEVLLRRCRTARCRSRSTSTARCTTAATTAGCRCRSCPWACSAEFRLPGGDLARPDRPLLPAAPAGSRCSEDTLRALQRREGARAALPTLDACVAELLDGAGAMRARERAGRLAALRGLRALPLHAGRDQERHADAVRDRLPARLRRALDTTFDHLELRCVVEGGGERSRPRCASSRRAASATSAEPQRASRARGEFDVGGLSVRTAARASTPLDGGRRLRLVRVENRTDAPAGPRPGGRARALADLDAPAPARGRRALRLASSTRRATASTPGRCSPRRRTT